jgi:hypothetical protein
MERDCELFADLSYDFFCDGVVATGYSKVVDLAEEKNLGSVNGLLIDEFFMRG